ncbi:hypothetical protein GE061_013207 [Apolygus lucorum]|uniref:Uncharacterized protein n=1 Tax=Apolygus lucorum TaxID=248454 RepID=A0A6A4JQM0_APOLU|nr:hypothetical protein GE061_013207 [Apolygus lucorum]
MDSDRGGRDSRRKKYSSREKDREPQKKMVILMKSKESKAEEPPPTILLKPKDSERAASPQATDSKAASKTSENQYQLAPRSVPSAVGTAIAAPLQMKESIKLMDDDTLIINDSLLEYLSDSNDFLVVGCIGLQGVGKSSILSHLANPASISSPDQMVFKVQTKSQVDSNSHCTEGVQCYVTDQRVILLDTQPLLSLSVLSKFYATDGAGLAVRTCHRDDPDFPCLENDVEILFLQFIAFVLSVCHVVVVVQDYFHDPDLIRFIQTAEMLKPPTAQSDDESDYFPHCVFIHNRCTQQAFSHSNVRDIQNSYKAMFSRSQLLIQSGLGTANGVFMPSLNPELCQGDPINLYLLPERRRPDQKLLYEVKDYEEIIDLIRTQIHGVPVMPLTHTTLSEKNWFHYAVKVWEDIKKSPLFSEYGRMLPTSSSFKTEQ